MKPRLLAASDIHGHGHTLLELLDTAQYSPGNDQLVLCGDYVNNGPDSEGTLEIVQQLQTDGAIVLLGNHELRWLDEIAAAELAMQHKLKMTYQRIQNDWGKLKWRPLLESFDKYYETAEFLFIHAGVLPNIPLDKQTAAEVTGFDKKKDLKNAYPGKYMVHGHVPTFREGCGPGEMKVTDEAVNIDTGAGHGEYLTLLDLTNQKQYCKKVERAGQR